MSFIKETNSSMPKIVGGGLILAGSLSALSLAVDAPAILNMPGGGFWDTVGAVGAAVVGYAIMRERSVVGAWLGIGLLALGLTSAGWEFNKGQAENMLNAGYTAMKAGATAGAQAGADAVSGTHAGWVAEGELTPAAIAECQEGTMKWTQTPLGKIRCTPASDGKYYKWIRG